MFLASAVTDANIDLEDMFKHVFIIIFVSNKILQTQ